ncbi:Short-chain dehydrogenase/reductase SDR [Dillenia turbinata]|uniref:Short-chain dehydrogenase/reductase SDR n=1 Tax=Dillenia turbinata TaxID=194707 RepID=A0AAN8UR36_9MAGN
MDSEKRYAVVTGSNKGIGFEVCKQLAANGVMVVLTARDEKKGLEALEKLKLESGISENVIFHQLDVTDQSSVDAFADFIKAKFGRLDILVSNAGIGGAVVDYDAFKAKGQLVIDSHENDWTGMLTETPALTQECLNTNYYGAKRVVEAFVPLLGLSKRPKIVIVSSTMGKLKNISNKWAKGVLSDVEGLTEEKIDGVLNKYKSDFKQGSLEREGWPKYLSAYMVSKSALSAYTRLIARKYPNICINCICPGFVKTDINGFTGFLTVEDGAESIAKLALRSDNKTTGCFFFRDEVSSFE